MGAQKPEEEFCAQGREMAKAGRYDEAIEYFDKAIKTNPDYLDALIDKGIMLVYYAKKFEEALSCFDRAVELYPEKPVPYLGKCLALRHLGRKKESEECAKKASETDPKFMMNLCDNIQRELDEEVIRKGGLIYWFKKRGIKKRMKKRFERELYENDELLWMLTKIEEISRIGCGVFPHSRVMNFYARMALGDYLEREGQ